MSRLGEIGSNTNLHAVLDEDFAEASDTTTSGTLEDVTGTSFTLTIPVGLPSTATIVARMTFNCNTTGGSPATGAWAISINSVDGTELQRYMSGTNDSGIGAVQARVTGLSNGTYTVVGRHRRVSGSATVNTNSAQLEALAVLET
jgi:hypothetical protein